VNKENDEKAEDDHFELFYAEDLVQNEGFVEVQEETPSQIEEKRVK
jgi:hypothetical protein